MLGLVLLRFYLSASGCHCDCVGMICESVRVTHVVRAGVSVRSECLCAADHATHQVTVRKTQ